MLLRQDVLELLKIKAYPTLAYYMHLDTGKIKLSQSQFNDHWHKFCNAFNMARLYTLIEEHFNTKYAIVHLYTAEGTFVGAF